MKATCSAIWEVRWLQLQWSCLLTQAHISIKEMVPIVIATVIWGELWWGRSVQIWSDNTAVVAAINNNSSRVREIAHLLCCLAFISAHWECHLTAAHLPGSQNCMADAISRSNIQLLHTLHPQAQGVWNAIFRRDWHLLLRRSTRQESKGTTSVDNSG